MPHDCQYKIINKEEKLVEADGEWVTWTKTPTCACGEEQDTQTGLPRLPHKRFSVPGNDRNVVSPALQQFATHLQRWKTASTRWGTILADSQWLGDAETVRHAILQLGRTGAVQLCENWRQGWHPSSVHYLDKDLLVEIANPGQRREWHDAVEAYIVPLPDCQGRENLLDVAVRHPTSWGPDTLRIAAAVVLHGVEGQQSYIRQFSTTVGDSKLVERHRRRIEAVLGSLGDFGIRRLDDQLMVAGNGCLQWSDARIDVVPEIGAIGIARSRLRDIEVVLAERVLFIENKEAFIAAAEGFAPTPEASLLVYMGGNFGSTIEHMLNRTQGAPFMWADLDPFGVGFVRRATQIRSDLEPWLMESSFLRGTGVNTLNSKFEAKLGLELNRGGVLQDTLIVMRDENVVLEQENQVHIAARSATG